MRIALDILGIGLLFLIYMFILLQINLKLEVNDLSIMSDNIMYGLSAVMAFVTYVVILIFFI